VARRGKNDEAARTTPVKVSGGAGFGYEDRASALFAAQLLSGYHPFGANFGPITRIQQQANALGWLIDDIVLGLASPRGDISCALSAKSFKYVTRSGFSADFVRLAWQQWLSGGPFVKGRDLLGIVTTKSVRRSRLCGLSSKRKQTGRTCRRS
jgi:hypothetical protein